MLIGHFKSTLYQGYCKGTLVAANKFAPEKYVHNPKNNVFNCVITYTGTFRNDQVLKFELDFTSPTKTPTEKAVVKIGSQVFTFTPSVYDINNKISGVYSSENPTDNGVFELEYTSTF